MNRSLINKFLPPLRVENSLKIALPRVAVGAAVVMLVLPPVAETPQPLRDRSGTIVYPGFPADDLYHFRLYSVGTQFVMWATIGVVFATLSLRLLGERSRSEQEQSGAA